MICSLGMCPPTTLIGPVLGAWSLRRQARMPELRGRRVAIGAIVIGMTFTMLWVTGLTWWQASVRGPVKDGPVAALQAASNDDAQAFLAQFETGRGDEEQARAFTRQLSERFGRFKSMSIDESRQGTVAPDGQSAIETPYLAKFERGEVPLRASFALFAPSSFWPDPILLWRSIIVEDAERGNLSYPAAP